MTRTICRESWRHMCSYRNKTLRYSEPQRSNGTRVVLTQPILPRQYSLTALYIYVYGLQKRFLS